MIWQLWKRRAALPTVFTTVFLGLIAVALAWVPLPPRMPTHEAMGKEFVSPLSLSLVLIVWLMMNLQSAWTVLDAGLPISGRDLWLSRLLAALGIVWLPSAAQAAFGLPPVRVFEAAAIITLFVIALACFRAGQFGWPKWLVRSLFQILILGPLATVWFKKYLRAIHWPAEPPPQIVFAICGVASLALFLWGLANAPQSYQFAPIEAGAGPTSRDAREESAGWAWAPLLHSIYPLWQMVVLFFFVVESQLRGQSGIGVLAAIPLIPIIGKSRWLLALPISQRKLFASLAIAPVLAVIVGFLASFYLAGNRPATLRDGLIHFAAELTGVFLTIFLAELPYSPWLSRLPAWMRWVPFLSAFLAMPLAIGFGDDNVVERLSAALPQIGLPFAAALAIPLLASYWLAQEAFARREYRALYIETRNFSPRSVT